MVNLRRPTKRQSMNALKSIFRNKCPQCHDSQVFVSKKFYNLRKFSKMNTNCDSCGLVYEKEVGFFYGAMYISYGLTSGFFIVSYLIDQMYIHAKVGNFILFIFIVFLLLMPITYRLSRLIWLNIFFPYGKGISKK